MSCIHSEVEKFSILSDKVIFKNKVCKYYINNYSTDISIDEQNQLINSAFDEWNQKLSIHGYLLLVTSDKMEADLNIYFVGGDTGLHPKDDYKYVMNDPGMIGFFVPGTDLLYLNDDIDFNKQVNLKIALIHEIGHALGIGHTNVKNDYMYPEYEPHNYFTQDSINAIRKLYASKSIKNSLLNLTIWEAIGIVTVFALTYKFLSNAFN